MEQKYIIKRSPMPLGADSFDFRQFLDILPRANPEQLEAMRNQINEELRSRKTTPSDNFSNNPLPSFFDDCVRGERWIIQSPRGSKDIPSGLGQPPLPDGFSFDKVEL